MDRVHTDALPVDVANVPVALGDHEVLLSIDDTVSRGEHPPATQKHARATDLASAEWCVEEHRGLLAIREPRPRLADTRFSIPNVDIVAADATVAVFVGPRLREPLDGSSQLIRRGRFEVSNLRLCGLDERGIQTVGMDVYHLPDFAMAVSPVPEHSRCQGQWFLVVHDAAELLGGLRVLGIPNVLDVGPDEPTVVDLIVARPAVGVGPGSVFVVDHGPSISLGNERIGARGLVGTRGLVGVEFLDEALIVGNVAAGKQSHRAEPGEESSLLDLHGDSPGTSGPSRAGSSCS